MESQRATLLLCFVTDLLISLSLLVWEGEVLCALCLRHCVIYIMSVWSDSPNSPQFCCSGEVLQLNKNTLSHTTHSLTLPLRDRRRINCMHTNYLCSGIAKTSPYNIHYAWGRRRCCERWSASAGEKKIITHAFKIWTCNRREPVFKCEN